MGVRGWVGVVWCGVVWCGVVWCGVVWCGVVWCGGVWCGVVWCGVVWCMIFGNAAFHQQQTVIVAQLCVNVDQLLTLYIDVWPIV